jgi:putative nucleotidyltransferase with HDIG domain
MNLISIEDVKSGMILARDVINDLGIVFMSSGTALNPASIEGLRKLDIDFVYVQENEEMNKAVDADDISLEQAYSRLLTYYKTIYTNVRLGKSLNVSQLSLETLPLFRKICEDNNILNYLRRVVVEESYLYKHSVNVGIFAMIMAKWLNLTTVIQDDLAIAGLLHDIGKTKVAPEIINKPSGLSVEEYEQVKQHSIYAYEILTNATGVDPNIVEGILYHHERIDGSGYPEGKTAREIPLYSKILAVADVFDAITANKTYKSKISVYEAARVLKTESFNKLEPKITEVFLKNISRFYVGNMVKLNTGAVGEVILLNKADVTRPLIRVGEEYFDLSTNYSLEIVDVVG